MKATFTFISLLLTNVALMAQTTATFEDFGLEPGNFINDAGGDGGFSDGNVFLPNNYDPQFDSWTGWAISADTDTDTPGYLNQHSSITGKGQDGSDSYAVTYAPFPNYTSTLELTGPAVGGTVEGFYITNNTYAYLSMLEGDDFAKKFGGETGDDPDFLRVTIKKYLGGQLSADSIDFYLADYRFSDNSQDYIVNTWTFVDLSSLGNADSLLFSFASSDGGGFGINTPTYFCMDNLTTSDMPVAVDEAAFDVAVSVFPNPAVDFLSVNWEGPEELNAEIYTINGQLLQQKTGLHSGDKLDIQQLNTGMYWLQLINEEGQQMVRKIVKRR